ncbi:restriction endonuclease [Pseudotamlana carrageenivorans]|uniref:Restriction endonuclease n=1 Tax=Pseudotamlana carrageenivorans TaxID=2069432 RepID=A0A2I7SFX1_9FLAO|nr:restriction endonuclease [Tamlana carrageenivorans]AUS04811.1 restriction endonuclease [Tamlana carrageenivorans]
MEIPKFHETFIPILKILENEETLQTRELYQKVIDKFFSKLSKEKLDKKTKSGELLIINRIAWGKSYLKKGGYIEFPKRGFVKITDKGKKHNSNTLTLKQVESSDNFLEFYSEENPKENLTPIKTSNASPQDLIDEGFNSIDVQVKDELLEKLKTIDPFYFEKVILILLKKMGYGDFVETAKTGDGGIDGIINEDKLGLDKIYIQAKRYGENKVREKDIRNFIGAMSGDTQKGVFVTTSTFDKGAVKKANDAHHTIILIDGSKLVDLMHQYGVGVQIKIIYEVKELDNDFFDSE